MWRTSYLAVSVALVGPVQDLQELEASLPGGLSAEARALSVALRAEQKRARAAALATPLAGVLRAVEGMRLTWP